MQADHRRRFLLASGALLAAPLVSAQSSDASRVRKIGLLLPYGIPNVPPSEYWSTKTLAKLGWIDGQNIAIERRYADLKFARLKGFAQDLIRKGVELIVAEGPEAAMAAARETTKIPVVFYNVQYPLEHGLVDSLARPGRNVTGTSTYRIGLTEKRWEFLREIVPEVKRVFTLYPSYIDDTVSGAPATFMVSAREAVSGLGYENRQHRIHEVADIDAAMAAAVAWGAQALAVAGTIVNYSAKRVAELALRHRLPSICTWRGNVEAGGLLSYGPTPADVSTLIGRSYAYVDRILRGSAKPAELPVEQGRSYELVINLKAAKALGITVPQSMLARADELIQ